MADLITLAQYEALMGTPALTDVPKVTSLISSASRGIERFCDRALVQATFVEWLWSGSQNGAYFPQQYPTIGLYGAYCAGTAATAVNGSSTPLVLVATATELTVFNPVTLASKAYVFTTYVTLARLFAAVTADNPALTFTLSIDGNTSSTLLYPSSITVGLPSGNAVIRAACTPISARMERGGQVLFTTGLSLGGFDTINGLAQIDGPSNTGNICLVYTAGYNPVPSDLQYITACIVRDMLDVLNNDTNSGMRSEHVSEYSYDIIPSINFDDLIRTKYFSALSAFRRIAI